MARAYMAMTQGEACGKCVPGRMGTKVAADILARIADGRGEEGDIQTLRNVGELVRAGSMCELCHTSMNGVLAMLDHYEEVFRQAITDGGAHHAARAGAITRRSPRRASRRAPSGWTSRATSRTSRPAATPSRSR